MSDSETDLDDSETDLDITIELINKGKQIFIFNPLSLYF